MNPNNERVDGLLRDLEAELAVRPSPEFVARVRMQTQTQRQSSPPPFRIVWMAVAASVALAIGVSAVVWRSHDRAGRVVESTPAAVVPPAVARSETPRPVVTQAIVRAPSPRMAARAPLTTVRAHELEVLVSPDEALALERFVAGLRRGLASVPPETGPELDAEGRLARLPAIEIPLIPVQTFPPPANGGERREL